jgi:drug/metabolite transporter (DMT)-like permease
MTALKAVLAVVVSAAGALVVALGTGNNGTLSSLDTKTWLLAVGTVLGSGGIVYFVENGPAHAYIKTVVAFLSAGIASVVTALNDGHITQTEWLVAFVAAVTATGFVYQATNTARKSTP